MTWKIWRDLAIITGVFLVVWIVATRFDFDFGESPELITPQKEEELARLLFEEILQEYDFLKSPQVDSAVQLVIDRLLDGLDSSEYTYQVRIIEQPHVNAFATFGGNIFLFTGLLKYVEGPEELAIILAHEIGHVENQHVVDKLAKQLGMEILFAILTGGDPVLVSEISKIVVSTAFDREKEREADEFAMQLALRSGINPRRMGQFFIRSLDKTNSFQEQLEFLLSHPHSKNRIESVLEFDMPEEFQEIPFDLNWEVVQDAI